MANKPVVDGASRSTGVSGALAPLAVNPDIVVAADGTGDFLSVHAAVQSINPNNRERVIMLIKKGVYNEKVRVDAARVTLRGESRTETRIEAAVAQGIGRDERGQGVLNLAATAHDCVIENLTVRNTQGKLGIHAFAIFGRADRTVIQDCDVLSHGNDTLSLWRGRAEDASEVAAAMPRNDPSILKDGGRYYHARLRVEGSVDFICPRGWCYLVDSQITQLNPGASAAVWHDGSDDPDKKFVLKNCTFDGPPNWYLARRHHDGHFYFIDCEFSERMRDRPPYRQMYPLSGETPTQADIERNQRYDRTNKFGDRNYFFNSRRRDGDFPWHRDNLASAPGAPKSDQITARWTFDGTWDPERTDSPRAIGLESDASGRILVSFSEAITARGRPRIVLADGGFAELASGSGTRQLVFALTTPAAATHPMRPKLDLNGGAIFACEAGASLRLAALDLPLEQDARTTSSLLAFPGAEGFGANTPGGRGGRVIFVTNLEDSGLGSFRDACEASGPRLVLFRVSGTIALKSDITVTQPFLTVAGQTAPGGGICLRDATFGIATHDVVVRHLRSRLGDETGRQADAFDVLHGSRNVVLDHISATWSVDEALSLSGNNQFITIQWCLMGESLRQSKHAKGAHGFGSLARANGPVTFHHNLWIHNDARNPRLGDNYGRGPGFPTFDVRNNVIYNYGVTASGLTQGILKVNYVANYLRPGPNSRAKTPITVGPDRSDMAFFIRDNVVDGMDEFTRDNARFFSQVDANGKPVVRLLDQPHAVPQVTTVSAAEALEQVLANVGATRPKRDTVDARLVEHVRTRTGRMINSQSEVGGWPELEQGALPADTDNDGISDAFELRHSLDPKDATDAARLAPSGYTWIEEYLNELAK